MTNISIFRGYKENIDLYLYIHGIQGEYWLISLYSRDIRRILTTISIFRRYKEDRRAYKNEWEYIYVWKKNKRERRNYSPRRKNTKQDKSMTRITMSDLILGIQCEQIVFSFNILGNPSPESPPLAWNYFIKMVKSRNLSN